MTGVEPLHRIAAACLLLFHFGLLARVASRFPDAGSQFRRWSRARFFLTSAWVGLVLVAIIYPAPLVPWDFEMIEVVRWLSLLPPVLATFLGTWSLRSRLAVSPSGEVIAEGAYRWCRYPFDGARGIFILGAGVFFANFFVLIASIAIFFGLRVLVPWEQERRRRQVFGEGYLDYADESGVFLPSVEAVPQKEYTVPSRFGMTAILGLLTTLAIIFGALNYSKAPPIVYLFIGSEIVAICLAQIFLGSAARSGSALTGAILLPFWAYVMVHIPRFDPLAHTAILASMVAVGALIGYCIGALAAGFFLAMDLLESLFTSRAGQDPEPPDSGGEPPLPDTEPRRYKELKARIAPRP